MSALSVEDDLVYRPTLNADFEKRARLNNWARIKKLRKEVAILEGRLRERALEAIELRATIKALADAKALDADLENRAELAGRITTKEIIALVAKRHGLLPGDITGPRRSKHIVAARWRAIAETRRLRPDLSLPQIGRAFNRNHTLILYVLRACELPTARQTQCK